MENTNINWFPGHMAKAIKEIKERANIVDLILEVCDARAPFATSNPFVLDIVGSKRYIKILNKSDMADSNRTKAVIASFKEKGIEVIEASATQAAFLGIITDKIKEIAEPIYQKDIKRGLKPRLIRVMVVGIPNVGKSTLINLLKGKKSASVANTPGHTRSLQWIKCPNFELLDTPGILWPNLKENDNGLKLAAIGCIKQEILPEMEMASYCLSFLNTNYPQLLKDKYNIDYDNFDSFIEKFSRQRGHLLKNNECDYSRSYSVILNDFKNGAFGKISME